LELGQARGQRAPEFQAESFGSDDDRQARAQTALLIENHDLVCEPSTDGGERFRLRMRFDHGDAEPRPVLVHHDALRKAVPHGGERLIRPVRPHVLTRARFELAHELEEIRICNVQELGEQRFAPRRAHMDALRGRERQRDGAMRRDEDVG
jgi:hypothetical protein